jgi:hypothetical protein
MDDNFTQDLHQIDEEIREIQGDFSYNYDGAVNDS